MEVVMNSKERHEFMQSKKIKMIDRIENEYHRNLVAAKNKMLQETGFISCELCNSQKVALDLCILTNDSGKEYTLLLCKDCAYNHR
jgi:hypothetical protein